MFLTETQEAKAVVEKWSAELDYSDDRTPALSNPYDRWVTAQLMENAAKQPNSGLLTEATPNNVTGGIAKYDPVLISMVRRSAPQLIAPEIMGHQPMSGPSGLAFALTVHYGDQASADWDNEAWYQEPDSAFSGFSSDGSAGHETPVASDTEEDPFAALYTTGTGATTAAHEGDIEAEMSIKVDKISVNARTRSLRGTWSREMEQDMRSIHNLDAGSIMSGLMTDEITAEINRQAVRTLYIVAKEGAQTDTTTPGIFDCVNDSNGRWMVEKFKGLMFHIEREANRIFFETRRGRGNMIIASADVVSALAEAGKLDYNSPLNTANSGMNHDMGQGTFAGVLNGKYRVYIDPYVTNRNFVVVGYKGPNPVDAGLFFCPYIPMWPAETIDPHSGQPIIFFKTRYGMVANPFILDGAGNMDGENMTPNRNLYYRKFRVDNLM